MQKRSCGYSPESFLSLGVLGFFVKGMPGIVVVGGEHGPTAEAAGEVVMAVEIPVAVHLNKPGATAGAASHITRNGDYCTAAMFPGRAETFTGLPGLTIERRLSGVAIGVEGLIGGLIIGPTGTSNDVG